MRPSATRPELEERRCFHCGGVLLQVEGLERLVESGARIHVACRRCRKMNHVPTAREARDRIEGAKEARK